MAVVPKRPKLKPTGAQIGGLPTYSKAQFQQVRPGGSYQSYVNFLKTRRGNAPGPAWPGRGGPGLPTIMSMMQKMKFETPAQIEARAKRMTNEQITAQQTLANDAARRAQADAARTHTALTEAGKAVAAANQGLISGVGGEYNAAARELANLGTGTVDAMAADTDRQVAATNEGLARVGAPSIQPGQMAGPQQAGIQRWLGAGLPGQTLVQQGQIEEFGLAGMQVAQNQRAVQEANAAFSQSTREVAQGRQAALLEIAQGRPEMAAQILSNLQTAERQNVALGMSLLEARRGALQTGFEQSVTKRQLTAAEKKAAADARQQQVANQQWTKQFNAAQQQAAKAGRQVDENRSIAYGYYVDQNGNPITKNGKKIKVPKTATAASGEKPEGLRAKMASSAEYWIRNRTTTRGGVTGSKEQLYNYLLTQFPGNPGIAKAIADSSYPGKAGGKVTKVK